MTRLLLDLALGPVCALQLLTMALRGLALPEAKGPRSGTVGEGPALRLLILGDSSAAGVGVRYHEDALSGQMLRHMVPYASVTWRLVARSGATTAKARRLLRFADVGRQDVAVLALGVNDVLRQTRAGRFCDAQARLMEELRETHGVRRIRVSGVPPLGEFTVFPQPLRRTLGMRATLLDDKLRGVCAECGALHVPFQAASAAGPLARDGLHPGPVLYADWGARMAGLALAPLS